MMFQFFTSSLLITLLSACMWSVDGACLPCQRRYNYTWHPELGRRDVYSPKITSPNSDTQWKVGSQVTVRWSLDDMPKKISNTEGKLVLGKINEGSSSENLDLKHPLADHFDIRQGQVSFKAPSVPAGNNYIVVLFGDSGNRSPTFYIS